LARNLRSIIEAHNDIHRDSENFETRRRALNMDKFEEIFDHIVKGKRDNIRSNVFNKVDILDTKKYCRGVTCESEILSENQKK